MSLGRISSKEYFDTVKVFGQKNNAVNKNQDYSIAHYEKSMSLTDKKRLLSERESAPKTKSILESTLSYGKQLRESRVNSKSTSNEMKKLKYSFKDISSQIRKAKTSTNAKQVASKARREVAQLKAKLQTGKYDADELNAAIDHAKAMERAAKKKARHLEEEELIKITDKTAGAGLTASELEEKLEEETDKAIEEFEAEQEEEMEAMEEVQQMIEESVEESMEEVTEDMYDLLADSMEDMMEETLENLMDGMMIVTDYEMTEDEFNAYRQKHRASEDKAMLEADAKYLKAIFDMYSKKMGGSSGNIPGMSGASAAGSFDIVSPISVDAGVSIPNIVDISV